MIDIIEMIPSKDMREALRASGRTFTDMETATLIHNLGLPPLRRRELLQELLSETEDETLREQLQYSLADEEYLLTRFREVSDGYVFGVIVHDEDIDDDDDFVGDNSIDVYFANFAAAFEYGRKSGCTFCIRKWRAFDAVPQGEVRWFDGDCGREEFAVSGELTEAWLWHESNPEQPEEWQCAPNIIMGEKWPHYQYFEDRWLDLPNLYQLGDIVRALGGMASYVDPAYDWAVVNVDNADWNAFNAKTAKELQAIEDGTYKPEGVVPDYSDVQLTVEFPCKDGTFTHDHINPIFLERVEEEADGSEGQLREMAAWAVKGKCGLEYTSDVLKGRILAAHAQSALRKKWAM